MKPVKEKTRNPSGRTQRLGGHSVRSPLAVVKIPVGYVSSRGKFRKDPVWQSLKKFPHGTAQKIQKRSKESSFPKDSGILLKTTNVMPDYSISFERAE